jgi:hypothetical protein
MTASNEAISNARWRAKVFMSALADETSQNFSLNFDGVALSSVNMGTVTSNGPGHTSCELPVTERVCNAMGTLHGGCIGMVLAQDCLTECSLPGTSALPFKHGGTWMR